jgi:3D-(3,5/4)-trihydroxycyclohexane-1,2-dione acylhydrolase (decyclizing)
MVGDGSYLMMAQELVTAVQEGVDLLVVLVQNQGFASIGELSESLGSQRFGTRYRFRDAGTGRLDGDVLPVDLAANAESLGVRVLRASGIEDFRPSSAQARARPAPVLVHVETDPLVPAPARVVVGRAGRRGVHWTRHRRRASRTRPRRPPSDPYLGQG